MLRQVPNTNRLTAQLLRSNVVQLAERARIERGEAVLPLWWTNDGGTCQCPAHSECRSPGKHPLVAHGVNDATLDPRKLEEWGLQWPQANLGGRTDVIHRFDIDLPEVAEILFPESSLFLQTEIVRTPRPGMHISFLPEAAMTTRNLYLEDGRRLGELRGVDSYVVLPPSRIGQRCYQLLSPPDVGALALSEPENWLRDLLREFGYSLASRPPRKEYERLAGPILEGEGRHNVLTSIAGRIWVEGMSPRGFVGALDAINQEQCKPPLPRDELDGIADHFINRREQGAPNGNIHSADYREGASAETIFPSFVFRTAREIALATPGKTDWIGRPWLARGALTEIDGKVKVSGKTTFMTYMCRCVLDGQPFMGEPTSKTPVVYLTEQGDSSFKQALQRAGLLDRDDLSILSWHHARQASWEAAIAAAVEECERRDASLLIVDTLPQFARIEGDGENASGPALEAVRPLQAAAAERRIAIAFTRHERKSGGDVGDSGRGSSAFAGAVDIVVSIRRREGYASSNVRILHSLSRFDETPATLVIELGETGYRALGNEKAMAVHEARLKILDRLPRAPGSGRTIDEVVAELDIPRTTLQEALQGLVDSSEVERIGGGKRGDPYCFRRL